jgi:hypothetical protein
MTPALLEKPIGFRHCKPIGFCMQAPAGRRTDGQDQCAGEAGERHPRGDRRVRDRRLPRHHPSGDRQAGRRHAAEWLYDTAGKLGLKLQLSLTNADIDQAGQTGGKLIIPGIHGYGTTP